MSVKSSREVQPTSKGTNAWTLVGDVSVDRASARSAAYLPQRFEKKQLVGGDDSLVPVLASSAYDDPSGSEHAESKETSLSERGLLALCKNFSAASFGLSGVKMQLKKGGDWSLPPEIQVTPTLRHTFRFTSSAGGTSGISAIDLLASLGGLCTVTNSIFTCMASSFKIHSIKIWGGPSSSSTSRTSITWNSAYATQMPDREKNRTLPQGSSVPACCAETPPRGSLAGDWINPVAGQANNIFTLAYDNAGSVLDLDVSYTLSNQFTTSGISIATGVLQKAYYLALDGPSANNWPPVALPTTH